MIRRRTITSYVWNSVSGNKMVILSNCIRNFFRKFELIGNSAQGENPAPDNPQEIKSAGKWNEGTQKYEIDVKVTGKNLFNAEKARDTANWIIRDGDGYAKFPIRVGKGNEATFSYTEKLTPGKGFYLGIAQSDTGSAVGWLYHSTEINLNNNKFTVVAKGDCLYLSCNKTSIQKFFDTIQTLQVEMGSEPTPYEPYTEQTVQIAIDKPLRGVGEYKDTITKDGIVRKIKRTVFDGSEDEKWGIGIEREYVIHFVSTQFSDATKINEHQRSMMDKLKWSSGVWGRDEIGQDMFARILRINMPKTLTPDLQTFKTWLSQNPLTVDYVLAEPVTEPLPESVQAQFAALHSENGTTHVFVDSGEVETGINIEYKYKS